MTLYLDFIGMAFSLGILWGLVPNTNLNPILKIILTIFFVLDHCGVMPVVAARIDEIDVNIEGDDDDDNKGN